MSQSAAAAQSSGSRWIAVSYVYAAIVACGLGYFLFRIPIQLTDSFWNMVALDQSYGELLFGLDDREYLRHGLWAQLKLVYDLADGNYFLWFRLTHALQVLLLLILFVRLLQPRTMIAAAIVPLALAVLIGHRAFAPLVREGFPINTFLTILLCCAAAANLAFTRHRWWNDVLAIALFVFAALTVETGLLVWVIFAAAFAIGLRGVSVRGIAGVTASLVAYFVLRLSMGIGTPGLQTRNAGFWFERYSGEQLVAMFGDNPLPFYAYNVISSILGVVVGEPKDGIWRVARAATLGTSDPAAVLAMVASVLATLLLGRYAWKRRQSWAQLALDRRDRLVLLFAAVLVPNAVMCYAYTKDAVMSPAAFFFAAAVFAAAVDLVESLPGRRITRAAVAGAFLAVTSCAWSARAVGVHAGLTGAAAQVREQWADYEEWATARGVVLDAGDRALKEQLQDDAIVRHPMKPQLRVEFTRFFEME